MKQNYIVAISFVTSLFLVQNRLCVSAPRRIFVLTTSLSSCRKPADRAVTVTKDGRGRP